MKICPRCSSKTVYAKSQTTRERICDQCGLIFEVSQCISPIVQKKIYKHTGLKGNYYISIWYCPVDKTKYSYAHSFGNSLLHEYKEFAQSGFDACLSGIFNSVEDAMTAAIEDIFSEKKNDSTPQKIHLTPLQILGFPKIEGFGKPKFWFADEVWIKGSNDIGKTIIYGVCWNPHDKSWQYYVYSPKYKVCGIHLEKNISAVITDFENNEEN